MNRSVKINYRHYICIAFTVISGFASYLFPNGILRLLESVRDILTSFIYYVIEILSFNSDWISPTVLNFPEWKFAAQIWQPITFLPATLEEFLIFWGEYINLVFDWQNFNTYLVDLADISDILYRFTLLLIPLALLIVVKLNTKKSEICTERGLKSKQLLKFEAFLFNVVYPVVSWFKELILFCLDNRIYIYSWIILWGVHFNVFSILIDLIAYYIYFTASWDLTSIYNQLLKLQLDITPVVRFIPGIIWLLIGIFIYDRICRTMAYRKLRYALRCNEAVIRERGIVNIITGRMRKGKTQLATSMSIVAEKVIYDNMYDVMLKYERYFPNFPWQQFRDELDRMIDNREIVDLDSIRNRFLNMGKQFDTIIKFFPVDAYKEYRADKLVPVDRTFGYDYDHYPIEYNDGVRIIKLYKALEEYACAYYVFTVKTNLIFANYSIRDDSILNDVGNKPYRDNDFIRRDPELREYYSKYSHILDMDMLRLQTKMINNNEYARVLHPGAYVVSEIDKERKNMLELKELKMSSDEANQKNDGFNASLMMSGHANLVDYIPIIYFFGDLQRPENLGAGARELGDVIDIVDKTEIEPVLPFFSTYWFTEGVFKWIKNQWTSYKDEYDINRCDGTLFVYLIDNLITLIDNHYVKINNKFGMSTLTLEIQSGSMDGEPIIDYWRSMTCIDRAERYSSDCLKGVFKSTPANEKHIDDYVMYEGILPTPKELSQQHSYFYNGIHKLKGK